MARIDEVRERYEAVTERIFTDKKAFSDYLKYAGRFYKLPALQTMIMFDTAPNAAMVADYDTWERFGHHVRHGEKSIAVLNGDGLKHYFDISQTAGDKVPYQWILDKNTAQQYVDEFSKAEVMNFKTLSSCVNFLGEAAARNNINKAETALNISEKDKAAFEKSYISVTQYFIAARCELGSSFKYKNSALDLTAFDILHSKAEKEKLCEFIQIAAKTTLLSMEKSINKIIAERSIEHGRDQTDMVRGGQEVLSRDHNGERQNVQARPDEVRLSGTAGNGADGGRSGTYEGAGRPLGSRVEEVHDGELPRGNTVASRSASVGTDTPSGRQGSMGAVGAAAEAVREGKSPSENDIHGDRSVGTDERLRSGARSNGTGSADTQELNEISGAAAEEISPAVSFYNIEQISAWAAARVEDNENIKRAFLEYTAANEDNEPVYDSFTTYEWFENDVKASVNILFSGISNGGIAVSEIPREQIEAFLQDYRDNSEIRDEADSMIADLVLKSLTQQEKVRAFARENDIPFKEQAPTAETDVQDIDPYAYDGSMSLEDARKTADAHNLQEFMENYDDELKMAAALYSSDEFKQFYERRAYEELKQISVMQGGEWAEQLLDRDHLHTISELVAGGIYNQINNIQPDRKAEEIPDDLDKFYIDRENETVAWIYYNPDSSAGGQLVYNYFSFDDIFNANEQPDPMEYLQQICTQELLDRDSPYFADALEEFMTDSQDISNREEDYVDKLIALTEPRFAIYQLKDDEALRDYDFASAEELKKRGLYVDRENYDRVYRGRLRESETLDDIYERFNINHPSDFRGHSLSMSDIIAIKQDGQITAHYVDRFGFADVPDFTLSLEERVARRTLTDDLVKVSECQLASDEMDDLGDKLFNYENAPKYSGSDSSWLFGSGITADTFESITARYNDGEDVRAELAKAVFRTGSGNVYFLNSEGKNLTDFDYTAVSDESGIIFRTKGGYEISHSWETLGEAVITAARREYDRHQELNRQYREDLEVNGSLYLAMRDHRTIYLNKTAGVNNENLTDYRLEYIEHKGVVLTATNTENERVELRDYGIGNYDYIIHGLINGNGINADKYEVTGIESEPVFKVAANTEKGLDGEAFLQAYEKTERDTLIPRDILFVGSFEKCNRLAESLRLGEISQEAVKKRYNEKISQKQENPDLVIPPYDPENDNDDEKIDWSGYTKEIHSDLELSLIKGMEVGNHNTLELPFIPSDFKDFKLRINLVQYDSDYAVEYGLYNKNSKQYIHCDGFFGENALPDYDSFKDDVEAGISNRIFELREGLERFADVASHSVPVDESRRYDALETAKEYIREYISSEFEEEADFSDLSRVGLAYTTDAETELSISVYADLENYRIVKLYDEKIVSEEKFESVEDMLGTLGNLEFGDLVYLDEEQKSVVIEETEAIEPEAPEQPTFIMTSEQGETVQLNLFGEPMHEYEPIDRKIVGGVDIELALKNDLLKHGTGFADGKFRVEQYYREHKGDTKGFAKFLSKEFGIGGHSGDGAVGFSEHDGKGITLKIKLQNGERTAVSWNWKKVADRIARLIDNNEYITQEDIDRRISDAQFEMGFCSPDSHEYKSAKAILESYGLLDQEEQYHKDANEIKSGDSFKYRGKTVTVTDDSGIYSDDIVISREKKAGNSSFAVTENVNKYKFAREAEYIPATEQKKDTPAVDEPLIIDGEEILSTDDIAQLRDYFTNPDRAAEREARAQKLLAEAEAISFASENETDKHILTAARVGDFYEFFGDDAKKAAETLDIMLTSRHGQPMSGIPAHALETYKEQLESAGYTIVVDERPLSEILAKPQNQENTDEVKLRSTVIDLANGTVYDTDYQPPDAAEKHQPLEGVPVYKVGDHVEVDFAGTHYSGTLTYVGDIEVTVKPDVGYSWEVQAINRKIFDEHLREDSRNAHLFSMEQEKHDFTITDEHLGEGGAKAKFAANMAAINLLKQLESDNRRATPEEQETLSKYVGWGGLAQAFDENNSAWASEFVQLYEALSPEEYAAAKSTVINAHYTTPTVINAIYKGLETLGFDGGNILEPSMGVGNFFGVMPEEMRKHSRLYGIEIDSITGRIARQLYQNADIQIRGYEETSFSDNYFDAAVGNVPFGSYSVFDKRYNKENFFIHDYFFAKTLDKVAPNGIIAFVTTKGTLDKQNPKVREYLARRADLVGAIRLPNNTFKANAGTEVTTDIIFLQKREKMAVELPDWCYVGKTADGVPINNYFLDHPEMILGEMKQGMEFSLYGNAQETACAPIEGADLKEQLERAVRNLKLANAIQKRTHESEKQAGIIPAIPDVRNFTFAEVDGKMYFRENNNMTLVAETGKKLERIKALNELRFTFREILDAQSENCSDEELSSLQAKLNTQYDKFVKSCGYISDSENARAFGKDDDYNSLCALEIVDEEKKTVEKSDFFTKRTVKFIAEITHVDTPQEAMQVSIDTRGKMDIPYMARLCGQEPQAVIDALKADNLIYLNPVKADANDPLTGWEEASEYLSGNVREKLRTAEIFAKAAPEYERNIAALTDVLPPKLEAGDITARIGVSWVDVEDYQKFLEEYAKSRFTSPLRRTVTGEYKIENKNWETSAAATQIYGTRRMNAKTIFENLLNNRDVVVKDKITELDGREHYEINKKETELAQEKASKMKETFKHWLWEEPTRREKYVERYNNLFNCIVGRKYDGSHQTFPGMSPAFQLKPHQLNAVMRAKFGGNTLLAHCVGAGKSFCMTAATMEKKRLGLINKACVVVPKHLVGQMANEWLRLYPQAKILTASEKDFDKDHRQKFIGRCCTGDYDAVIMSYEQFEKIPMSVEYRRDFIQREIDVMQSGINELSGDYRSRSNNRSSIKDLEREKKRLETRLQKLIDGSGKVKDTSLTFEQLGFDSLVVDECHNYKNGLVVTKMNRVAGVQTRPAQKSEDILMKTQYLNENYGEKNILMASGTPLSNSMTELYVMQRYLRPSLLAQAGLQTFDDWASNFGEVVSKAEMKPAGNGYQTRKRFAKFNNVPELMQMFKEFADIQTEDMLKLPVPEIEGGKPQTIVAKPNDIQKVFMQELAARSEAIRSGKVDPKDDNMLKITGEARLLGLDARCIMPTAENYPDSKVNLCIDKVMEIYNATTENKGVQAIFCDIAVNSDDGRFSVYDYIKEELIRRGVPENEICFAGDADTQKQKNEMYAQLRSGTKRVVIASTSKMGTGANVQTKLCALHNLDIPWKPSDIMQRNGRIVRQGNENPVVGVYNYVTENTFDAYLMNIIVTKQRFISQLMSGKASSRSCEDMDEAVLNYSEIQALASGDDRIKEKIELDGEVARLRMLESEHYNAQYRLDDTIALTQKQITTHTANIEAAKKDIEYAAKNKPHDDEFKVEINGMVFTERKAAGEMLQKMAISVMAKENIPDHTPIGNFCGFELAIEKMRNGFAVGAGISLRNNLTYSAEIDIKGDIGNITRLENLYNKGIGKILSDFEDKLSRAQTDLQEAQAAKGKPFEHAGELAEKSARLEQLNRELEVGRVDEVIMNESENEDEEQELKNPENERDKPSTKHKL